MNTIVWYTTSALIKAIPYGIGFIKLDGAETALLQGIFSENLVPSKITKVKREKAVFNKEREGKMTDFFFVPEDEYDNWISKPEYEGRSIKMGPAKENLMKIVEKLYTIQKAQAVDVTNIAGKNVDWELSFQFNLDNENPFFLEIKNRKATLSDGTKSGVSIVMSGDPNAIVRICESKGDFTRAISREQITVENGKVMDVIRLTRAITIVLKTK